MNNPSMACLAFWQSLGAFLIFPFFVLQCTRVQCIEYFIFYLIFFFWETQHQQMIDFTLKTTLQSFMLHGYKSDGFRIGANSMIRCVEAHPKFSMNIGKKDSKCKQKSFNVKPMLWLMFWLLLLLPFRWLL